MWIINKKIDLFFIIFPGLICLLASYLSNNELFLLTLLGIVSIADTGHIYATWWRTIFHKKEFNRNRVLYLIVPLLAFFSLFILFQNGFYHIGLLIIYASVYHHIKQGIGIYKWYQKINSNYNKLNIWSMYLLLITPFIILHFRNDLPNNISMFYSNDFRIFSNTLLYEIFFYFHIAFLAYFIISNIIAKEIKNTSFFFALTTIIVQSIAFIYGNNIYQIFLPPLFAHGISYLFLIDKSYKKIQNKTSKIILLFPVAMGLCLYIFDNKVPEMGENTIDNLFFTLYLMPTVVHHIWDAFIWRKKHPEFDKIFD